MSKNMSRRHRQALFAPAAIVSFVAALSACGQATKPTPTPLPRVVFLADVSGSVQGDLMTSICLAAARRVVAHASTHQGSFTVETIDGNPMQDSRTPIDIRFAVPTQFAGNPVYADAIMSQLQASAIAGLARVMAQPAGTAGTDVLSGIEAGARDAGRPPLGPEPEVKYLVICSDMLNGVKPYNFYKLDLTPARISRIVRELKGAGRLPTTLRSVRVYVVGGGQSTNGRVTATKARQLYGFFTAYFAAAGAELVSYTPTLPSFP